MSGSDNVYIIFIKDEERYDWGFNKNDLARIIGSSGITSLNNSTSIDNFVGKAKSGTIIILNDYPVNMDDRSGLKKSILSKIHYNIRLFIHFGETNLDEFNRQKISLAFIGWLGGKCPPNCSVLPFSAHAPDYMVEDWISFIFEFRNWQKNLSGTLPKEDFQTLHLTDFKHHFDALNAAWRKGLRQFDQVKAMKELIEILFPLYVDIVNFKFAFPREEERSQQKIEEFRKDVIEHIKKILDKKRIPYLNILKNQAVTEPFDFEKLECFTGDMINLIRQDKGFLNWFDNLSKDYTNELGIGPPSLLCGTSEGNKG